MVKGPHSGRPSDPLLASKETVVLPGCDFAYVIAFYVDLLQVQITVANVVTQIPS
jgi:hypothetical protein